MRDFGYEAQRAAELHLERCSEALLENWLEDDFSGRYAIIDSPASAPFCGCGTCTIREILFAAWPILLEAAKTELASSGDAAQFLTMLERSADGAGAEQEDQPGGDGDGDQRKLTGSECHVLTLPPQPDVQT